jgi:hypothetical protein
MLPATRFRLREETRSLVIVRVGRQHSGGCLARPREHSTRRRGFALVIEQVKTPGKSGGCSVERHRLDNRQLLRPDDFLGRRITFEIDEVDEQSGSCPLEMRLQGHWVEPARIAQNLFKRHKGLRRVMSRQRREPRNFRLTAKMCGFQVLGANGVEDAAER